MELNEALSTLKKAGLIAEAKGSYKKFLPNDTDTIADIGVKILNLRKYYMSCKDTNERMLLAEIWNALQETLQKLNKKRLATVKDTEDDNWGHDYSDDELPSNEDRADADGNYMGSAYQHYNLDDPCSDEEWAAAGKRWARDARKNGDLSKEDYQDAVDHYKYYSWE